VTDNHDGTYTAVFTATAPGTARTITATIDGVAVTSALPTITVTQATPTITWSSPAAIVYGTALSGTQLDATASAVVDGSTVSVPGTFTYTLADGSTPALGAVLPAGQNQTLLVNFTPTDTTDFTSAPASTTLNVNPATPTISWPTPAAITYGTPLSGTQLDATASAAVNGNPVKVPGSFTSTPAAGTVLHAGTQTLSLTFTPLDKTDFTTTTASVSLVVKQVTPTVTWDNPGPITPGTPLSATQLDATASVPGSFTYTPAAGTVLKPGLGQTLSATFTPADSTDYSSVHASVSLEVLPLGGYRTPAGILYVVGTATSPNIEVGLSSDVVTVALHNGSANFHTPLAGLTGLVVLGQASHQHITVDRHLLLPAVLFAGNGIGATVKGGGGPTVEVGGSGNGDLLIGGAGRNILIARKGNAQLQALSSDPFDNAVIPWMNTTPTGSILIGGVTDFDSNLAALEAALATWASADSYSARLAALASTFNAKTVQDNGVVNQLAGSGTAASDWFFAYLGGSARDRLSGVGAGDVVTGIP
jgi:hypothetical protein